MIKIPVTTIDTDEGALNVPASPIPADAIAVECDGSNYIVYLPGDALPDSPAPEPSSD